MRIQSQNSNQNILNVIHIANQLRYQYQTPVKIWTISRFARPISGGQSQHSKRGRLLALMVCAHKPWLIWPQALGECAAQLLDALVDLLNLIILPGKVPSQLCSTFYGANLTALRKAEGEVRPIAVGLTIQRLAAKSIMSKLRSFNGKSPLNFAALKSHYKVTHFFLNFLTTRRCKTNWWKYYLNENLSFSINGFIKKYDFYLYDYIYMDPLISERLSFYGMKWAYFETR